MKNFLKENWLLILGIIYLIMPIDLVPDVVPVAGAVDDATILGIELIRRWLNSRPIK